MQHGVILTSGDPRTAADLAAEAEAAGWDGVFTYDAIAIGPDEMYDPWIVLAAMAMRTGRIRLGAMVFAPPRRRPWKLAREAFTLDVLSGGRLVLPVGLGALDDAGFGNVGEPVDARTRARLLDETLAIVDGLSSGEPFAFEGEHYLFGPMTFNPRPVQRPRIPVWVVGAWPHERSMRRALRWDGLVVQVAGAEGAPLPGPGPGPAVLAPIVDWVRRERPAELRDRPFEIIVDGVTPADDPAAAARIARAHEAAGATWWIEADWSNTSPEALRTRIAAGPPRA
jgi:alkanesulfonate monooxygenase SsuD/methylene tetrahydromethanopterin reductase-like flavin-dependent oxidoreductase (luciferase family)